MERCLGGSARVQAARGPHFVGLHAVFLFFTVGVSVFGFLLAIATVWIEAGAGSWLMCGFAASEHFADRRGFAFLVGFIRALLARCHPAGGVSWSLRKDAFGYTSLCGREVLALRSGASIDHGGEGERDHGVGGRTAIDPFPLAWEHATAYISWVVGLSTVRWTVAVSLPSSSFSAAGDASETRILSANGHDACALTVTPSEQEGVEDVTAAAGLRRVVLCDEADRCANVAPHPASKTATPSPATPLRAPCFAPDMCGGPGTLRHARYTTRRRRLITHCGVG